MTSTTSINPPHNTGLPRIRHAIVVAVFTLGLSLVLHLLTRTPFFHVFGRVGFIGAALLLAYSAAGKLRPHWMPPGPARLLAVVFTAPLAALMTAVISQGSGFVAYLQKTETLLGHIMLVVLSLLFGTLFSVLALRTERRERERGDRLQLELERSTLERELLNARLRLLHAQIEPHFLFNTLANVEALVASKSDNAGPVLRHLIAYLRAAMPRLNDADANLGTELYLVRTYLELMHLRMPDRLQFFVSDIPELATTRFPAMTLLTLVENAVRHGIDPSIGGGRIDVDGQRDPVTGRVTLCVRDTGMGMSETAQPGTGLSNSRMRLQAFYGSDARLELHEEAPHGVRVELHFHPRENI